MPIDFATADLRRGGLIRLRRLFVIVLSLRPCEGCVIPPITSGGGSPPISGQGRGLMGRSPRPKGPRAGWSYWGWGSQLLNGSAPAAKRFSFILEALDGLSWNLLGPSSGKAWPPWPSPLNSPMLPPVLCLSVCLSHASNSKTVHFSASISRFMAYSSWVQPCPPSNASVLERLPSSTRRKDRCSVVSDLIR